MTAKPIPLPTLTIRPAGERRSRGSAALVRRMTPITLVAKTCSASEVGLRPEQGAIMMHLWAEGSVRQTELSRVRQGLRRHTRTVQRMEQAGFLRHRPDPTDGRASLVEPTAAGDLLRPRVERLWHQLERDVLARVAEDDRSPVSALLARLADGLSQRLEDPPHPVLDPI